MFCVTETLIKNGDISGSLLPSLLLLNYDLAQHYGWPLSMRNGVAIIKHNSINHTPIKTENLSSFECIGSVNTSSHSTFKLVVIYHSPSSSISKFLPNFNPYLNAISRQVLTCSFLAISISILIISTITTFKILKNLQNFSLPQHVFFPTHNSGHILDLIITNFSSKFNICPFCIDTCISDHKTVYVDLNLAKPHIK